MNACASLGPVNRPGSMTELRPFVLINDVPEPRLSVESFKVSGPLDLRTALVRIDEPVGPAGVPRAWLNSQATVAWPGRLNDDQTVWPVLIRGELKDVETSDREGQRDRIFELSDLWSQGLRESMSDIWQLNSGGSLIAKSEGALLIGQDSNRSASRYVVNGIPVHVIQPGTGVRWTVGSALETISASAGLGLLLVGLPRDVAESEIDEKIDLAKPLEGLLDALMSRYGLVIQRDIQRLAGVIHETRAVRPVGSGRPIRVVWANDDRPLGDALEVTVDRPAQPAQLWIARARGWLVESTFELVGGWDPALEGQANDEYDAGLSSDFATYADVYRNWVLNEDGFYSPPPYSRGPAYHLATLFDEDEVDPLALVFQANLTRDAEGFPLDPVVEMSTDGGSNWSVYPKSSAVLKDRAGVYLNSKSLPTTFLDAAKAGNARLRVTASLQSPLPVEVSRWNGNAFTSVLPPLIYDRSDTHFFQRVDADSIHHADVRSGAMDADEVDDFNRLLAWLVRRLGLRSQGGRASLELAGVWPLIRVGDSLREIRGPGVAAEGRAQALTRHGAAVQGYEARFTQGTNSGTTTRIDLIF